MRTLFFFFLFFCSLLPQAGKVVGVTDGDTMEMLIEGKSYKVRLAHIDAPEKKQAFGAKMVCISFKKHGVLETKVISFI